MSQEPGGQQAHVLTWLPPRRYPKPGRRRETGHKVESRGRGGPGEQR